jgi:hypothetical protein
MNTTQIDLRIFVLGLWATAVACGSETSTATDAGSTATGSTSTDATSTAPTGGDTTQASGSDSGGPTTGGSSGGPSADCLLNNLGSKKCFANDGLCFGFPPSWPEAEYFKLGDLTGDGLDDIVIRSVSAGEIHLVKSTCDGLGALPSLTTPGVQDMWLLDMDGDDDLDILAMSSESQGVFFRGDGTGLFATAYNGAFPGWVVSVGDLDEDGIDDLVTRDSSDLAVIHNDGAGGFSVARKLNIAADDVQAVIASLDPNVAPMIVTVSEKLYGDTPEGECIIQAFTDAGGMTLLTIPNNFLGGCDGPVVGDLDDDGAPDLVVGLAAYRGDGAGGLVSNVPAYLPFTATATCDLNGDSLLDLIGPSHLLRNASSFEFQAFEVDQGFVTPGDLNGDGLSDLVRWGDNELVIAIAMPP